MGFWDWFKPRPSPPKPQPTPTPAPPRRTMHIVVKSNKDEYVELITGEMGPAVIAGEWPTVYATPISFYMLSFEAPQQINFGDTVSIKIGAKGYQPLEMQVAFQPDVNIPGLQPVHPSARAGIARLQGWNWVDDDGMYYPFGSTLMWVIGGSHRGERDRCRQNFAWLRSKGCDVARMLAEVDWQGEETDPNWPDYPQTVADTIDLAYEEGLKTHLCITGGGHADPVLAAQKLLPVLQARREKLLLIEGVNESNGTNEQAIAIIDVLSAVGVPCALGLGNTGIDNINKATAHSKANACCLHEERSTDPARNIRQCWDFRLMDQAACCDEPQGPGSSVCEETKPFNLAAMRVARVICGAGYFVLHTGSGVFGKTYGYNATTPDGSEHSSMRYANLWEIPHADEIFEAVRLSISRLPRGICNWAKYNNGQEVVIDSGEASKLYGCRDGGRFCEIAIGTIGTTVFKATAPMQLQISDPSTGNILIERHVSAGERFSVSGLFAYLLVGSLG